ncbi:hypothetical protein ACFQZ4_21925 [Catellatospora coxensis]
MDSEPSLSGVPPRAILFDFYGTLTSACTRGPAHELAPRLLGCPPAEYFAVLNTSFYPAAAARTATPWRPCAGSPPSWAYA